MTGGRPAAPTHGWARPGAAWLALAAVLALASAAALLWPAQALDWQPALAAREPWRWWTAAWVHGSLAHALANLAGLALLALLGWRAAVPVAAAWAWALAWPLTQLGWLWRPGLAHFYGLSGVLHAGVAVLGAYCLRGPPAQRRLGVVILLALALKVGLEQPFGPLLRPAPSLGIAVAPWSHFSGSVAGLVCAWLLQAAHACRRSNESV